MNKNQSKITYITGAGITWFLGVMVIIGWFTHNSFLKSVAPGMVTMKVNVALGFVFSSTALLFFNFPGKNKIRYRISVVLCLLVFLIGLLTFAEYFFGLNMGIDQFLVKDNPGQVAMSYPGRMSPLSAINLMLLATGLFLLNNEKTATYQFFYLSVIALISLLMLIGFNFIADIPTFVNLSIYEAIGFMMLSGAVYFAQPMLQKKISFEQKFFTNFTAVIILLAVLSMFSSYYSDKRISTSKWIKHTNFVLHETEEILSLVKGIEGESSGYIITGDSNYLHHFMITKGDIFSHHKKLEALTRDNPSQQVRTDSLSVFIDKRIDFSLQAIRAKNERGVEGAKALMDTGQGRLYTDSVRNIISEIERQENSLLIQRQKENSESIVSFNRAFFVLLASIFILLIIIFTRIRRNNTLRKKAAEKIKENEYMFSTLFYKSPGLKAIIEVSTGKYIDVNDAFIDFFGNTKEYILGKTFIEINMLDQHQHEGIIKNIRQYGFVRELEMQVNSRNGKASWISANIDKLNLNGKDWFLLAGIDITKRKIAEDNLVTLSQELEAIVIERTEELNRSEKSYRYLFENNPQAMWVIDLNTFKFLDVNEMAILQYGYSREEFLSMTTLDIRPDEDKELFKQPDHLSEMNTTNYSRGIWNHRKKDGSIILAEVIAHKIIFQGVPGRLVLSSDITEKKKAEEKLIASEKRFRYTLDSMLEGAQIIGFDWRYRYVNDSMSRHGKYSKEELLGHTVMEKYPGIEQSPIYKVYERCFDERVAIHLEYEFTFPDKTTGWFECSFQPVPEGIFILSIDITDRKKAEFEIQKLNEELEEKIIDRTEELETANKELEAFSYSVSHDLRAPLRAINGFAKIIGENYGTIFDIEGHRMFNRIKVNATRMGLLIDNLLEFSRLGRKEIHKSPIQMTELVESTLLEINTTINHEAAVEIHELHSANADSTMIKQVMINLLSNAIKYSSKTEKPCIVIKSHLEENEVIYSISDNGVGFNNQFVDKLFGVFQRLHLKTDFEGTGVGLALVKRIINKHGGRVWAEGELNKGATFCFSLPATNNN